MTVLFFPHFYYMQYPPFQRVIRNLLDRGVDAKLVYIPGISEHDETNLYNPDTFLKDGVPYEQFSLIRFAGLKPGPLRPFLQYFQFQINKKRLKAFLLRHSPSVVVIGSHLGQMYIRQLQIFCYQLGIAVIAMWIIPATLAEKNNVPGFVARMLGIRDVLEWKFYNKYMTRHLFVTTGPALKADLVGYGVRPDQVRITGNPLHDRIHEALQLLSAETQRNILGELGIDPGGRYILFLTEVIQDVLGFDYLQSLIEILEPVFQKLPEGVNVVIKYHPREPESIRSLHRDVFAGDRYRFSESQDLIPLLRFADLSIGHFTSALETSLVVGTPCLCINGFRSDQYSFFKEEAFKLLECSDVQTLEEKLLMAMTDRSFQGEIRHLCRQWVDQNIGILDGNSARRMADVILDAPLSP
jgi:hypothetical protein